MDKVDKYVEELSPFYENIVALVVEIDESVEQFNVSEIGFFIASVATFKLLSKSDNLADEFNSKWLDYICKYYEKELGKKIKKKTLIFELQKKYPIYSKLFLDIIDQKNKNKKAYNASIQLTWELFTNTTGKKTPDQFLNLVLISGKILKLSLDIFNKTINYS